ncbi:hypothetical protein Tco_1060504 [Tanacetum coccineum]
MYSITAQQAKLDLELVPKEKRLEIGKCNRRLNPGKTQREPTFQVVLDALALTLMTLPTGSEWTERRNSTSIWKLSEISFRSALQYMVKTLMNFPLMKLLCLSSKNLVILGKSSQSPMLLLIRCINLEELLLLSSTEFYLERHPVLTSFDLHLLRRQESSRSLLLLNSLLSESHLKNPQGGQRELRYLPRSLLMRQQQYEEVYKKSLRDFNKTHPSGSGIVTSVAKIKPSVTNEGTGAKPGVPDVTKEDSSEKKGSDSEHETDENETGFQSDQEENEEEVEDDEEEKDDKFVKTSSNSTDKEDETNKESKVENKAEGDEDKGMDYPTNQFNDDVDQGNENLETTLNQVIEDAHVTLSTIAKKTEVPVTNSSHSFDLASKFLNFLDIPHIDAEIVSPMDVHVHHEVSISALEKDVAELKKDDLLNTQVTALVDEHLDSRLGATRASQDSILAKDSSQPQSTYEVAASLTKFELKKILIDKMDESQSYLTAAEHIECYDGLIKSYDLDKSLFSTYDKVYSLKRSRKDKDKDEDPSAGSN